MRSTTIDNAAARHLLQDRFVTETDLSPDPSAGLLHVEIHRGSRPVVDRTLTALFGQLNEMEIHLNSKASHTSRIRCPKSFEKQSSTTRIG
ncbi:MAG: hypothetical protein NTW21_36190 [Verrucomicrobia bacterium]|nr:hypothetical protein [Verrucomicrobiota bacterium]